MERSNKVRLIVSLFALLVTAAAILAYILSNPPVSPEDLDSGNINLPPNLILGIQIVVPIVGAFLLINGLYGPFMALNKLRTFFRIVSALNGKVPKDGRTVAIIGPIKADKQILSSPVSGEPCVAYDYRVVEYSRSAFKKGRLDCFSGWAFTPSYIDSTIGPIRILAVPDINLPWGKTYRDKKTKIRFRNYINRTNFNKTKFFRHGEDMFAGMWNDPITDRNRPITNDLRNVELDYDLSNSSFDERLLKPDEVVCATGLYSSSQQGLIHDPKVNEFSSIKIRRGHISKIMLPPFASSVAHLLWSIFFLSAFIGIFWAYFNIYLLYDLVQKFSKI